MPVISALLQRYAKMDVAEPIQLPYYSVFDADTLLQAVNLTFVSLNLPLTFDAEHIHHFGCHMVKLSTKFERNPRLRY